MRLEDALRAPRFRGANLYVKHATIPSLDASIITSGTLSVSGIINASTLIASDVIVTGHLAANSVNKITTASGGAVTCATVYNTAESVTITTTGGKVILSLSLTGWTDDVSGAFLLLVYRDSTANTLLDSAGLVSNNSSRTISTGLTLIDTPSAGTYTYYMQVKRFNSGSVHITDSTMIAQEIKR